LPITTRIDFSTIFIMVNITWLRVTRAPMSWMSKLSVSGGQMHNHFWLLKWYSNRDLGLYCTSKFFFFLLEVEGVSLMLKKSWRVLNYSLKNRFSLWDSFALLNILLGTVITNVHSVSGGHLDSHFRFCCFLLVVMCDSFTFFPIVKDSLGILRDSLRIVKRIVYGSI